MPRHQQVVTCQLTGGPITRQCTCPHCALAVCAICGAHEAGLTTDCPGTPVDFDKQREVHETCLDYTDDRGWHQGAPMEHRSPHFTSTRLTPMPPREDPRAIVGPNIDWNKIDRNTALQHQLTLRAIAWVLADRECDDRSAELARVKSTVPPGISAMPHTQCGKLRDAQTNFQKACRRVETCDDEFRQIARKLVDSLENGCPQDPRNLPCAPASQEK